MTEPSEVAPAKNSTDATVAGATATGVAATATVLPAVTEAPAVGAVIVTDGAVTDTLTMIDVAIRPVESVTFAVRAVIPETEGVQLTEKGAVSAVPMVVVPARKSTRLTEDPPLATALAVMVVAAPSASEVPLVGLVIETVGTAAATVTLTAEEVTVVPFESVTRAVNETVPVTVGVQSKL